MKLNRIEKAFLTVIIPLVAAALFLNGVVVCMVLTGTETWP